MFFAGAIGLIFLILIAVIVLVVVALIFIYNRLVVQRNRVDNGWAQIDVQLKKRYDLIPNLIETVKGYAKHEKEVFENVTKARSQAMQATGVGDQSQAENMITGALKSLFAVAENYPDLKANQNFMMLQEELSGVENKIAFARQFYNDTVMKYNTMIQTFPTNMIAGMLGFPEREYFEIEEASREPVKVQF